MRQIAVIENPLTEVVRLLVYITEEDGTSLYEYTTLEDGPCEYDHWFENEKQSYQYCEEKYGVPVGQWRTISDPVEHGQHDWIKPVRMKGRNTGKPDWGVYEQLVDGEWVEIKP